MRVLDARNVTVREELVLTEHAGQGHRVITRGGVTICDDGNDTYARVARLALMTPLVGKAVAWIGGGLCIGPRLFAIAARHQTVYEIEPSLREFCPEGVTFWPGDWRDSLTGTYDLIIYDLGGDVPREDLAKHLNKGGAILP